MGLWQKLANHANADSSKTPRGIVRAALEGAPFHELSQEAFWALEPVLRGKAQRFGVWFTNDLVTDRADAPESFEGRFWTDGREDDALEAYRAQPHSSFPGSLIAGGPAFEQQLSPDNAAHSGDEAVAGMRRAVWVPIRLGRELRGVLFAASRNSSAQFPLDDMNRVAAELALVIGFRTESEIAQGKAIEQAEIRKLWAESSSEASLDSVLQTITASVLHTGGKRTRAARFATLGLLSDSIAPANTSTNSASISSAGAVDFRWSAGDNILARSVSSEPICDIWRKALQARGTVGSAMPPRWAHSEISRVIAVPLLVFGQVRGVLVAGYHGSSATLSSLERLELRANLAAAAIAMAASRHSGDSAADTQFFVENCSDTVFLLNARMEIIGASIAAKALLSHSSSALPSPSNSISPHRDELHLISVAQIFKPAEWPRISVWLEKIVEPSVFSPTHSLGTLLKSGHPAQLRAAPRAAGGFTLIVADACLKEAGSSIRSASELQSLIEWLDEGVLLFDENESLRAASPRFSQLFGLEPRDLRNVSGLRDLVSLIAPRVSDPPQFAGRWWDAARGLESSLREEVRVLQPAARLLERISRPILDSGGVRVGRIEIYRDLTAQQHFQSKLRKSERLALLGEKLSSVAHELSNPLTTILGNAQRLLRRAGDSPHREDIQRIFSEADRASAILRQLLASTRESPIEPRPMDLDSLVLRAIELQRTQLASEKIRLELDLASSLPPVLCDGGQLQQILMNLISNARHALLAEKPGGAIHVRTRLADSGRVILEVSDSGPGIPEAHRHRIFDPFFTTKPSGIGTGLGLSIVMGLVRQNHGNIRVRSAPGQGATFTMDFPAAQAAPEVAAPVLPPALSSSAAPISRAGRVLVVEDESTVAQLIADMLSDLGYSCDVLHDARRALVSALNRDYLLIICDMKMPGLDGQHFYRALAEAGTLLASKFLFVTGDVLGISTREFLRHHRVPHIGKPFRLEEFAEKLALVLGPAATVASPLAELNAVSHKNLLTQG